MTSDPFVRRVQQLRDAWIERRQLKRFASSVDFESRFALLGELHRWTTDAIDQIQTVYGEQLILSVGPIPGSAETPPAFAVSFAGQYLITFAMWAREVTTNPAWQIRVSVAALTTTSPPASAGPERRTGQWTPSRLQELLLSLLQAWEKTLAGEPVPGAARATAS